MSFYSKNVHSDALEKEARDFFWRRNPKLVVASTMPDMIVGFVAGARSDWSASAAVAFADWLNNFQDMSCAMRKLELDTPEEVYWYFLGEVYEG